MQSHTISCCSDQHKSIALRARELTDEEGYDSDDDEVDPLLVKDLGAVEATVVREEGQPSDEEDDGRCDIEEEPGTGLHECIGAGQEEFGAEFRVTEEGLG